MKSAIRIAAALCFAMLFSRASLADEERGSTPWWFTLQGGPMFPSGPQGGGIRAGAQTVGTLGYELGPTFVLGGDLGYISSSDDLGTRLVMLGGHVRMNPSPDLAALHVQGGGGLYRISYRPKHPGLVVPRALVRPGLDFGIGYDVASLSKLTVGVVGLYHGILVGRSDALSYVALGLYVSFRPGAW